ncbi:DUF397 domain-containing protein [Streptomyces sp. NPDC048106]|uniref:DUF397 domain-containing protein n=1 Tax=Streptomyces sp. NPDC048106 TaxID=3155750 RepID=UPI003455BD0A
MRGSGSADRLIRVAIRDSKAPAVAALSFPAGAFVAFVAFVEILKDQSTATGFAMFRG